MGQALPVTDSAETLTAIKAPARLDMGAVFPKQQPFPFSPK